MHVVFILYVSDELSITDLYCTPKLVFLLESKGLEKRGLIRL